ncbi:chloramphenicol phosphotransferase CPT family protein [Horticoccus sp. 23ND18S-11]|uniref:chloramphenicol phosphotransferase CPT family protein n=1 Tax=Horticoccus sp. 23ND18S-11 TaxID=3391832 RepID=UPI0039C944C6
MKSAVIVLNGASSAGKTSIARAIQRLSKSPVLYASLDNFTDMFHWPAIGDLDVQRECHRVGVSNFHATLPILASSGFAVVVDHVFEQHAWFEATRNALSAKKTYFVGVHCPLDVLVDREKARGDRRVGLSRWQFDRVHVQKPYDLEVDTSKQSSESCASAVIDFVTNASNRANKAPEPTPVAVTPRAIEGDSK